VKNKELTDKVQRRFTKMINNMEGDLHMKKDYTVRSYGHLKSEGIGRIPSTF